MYVKGILSVFYVVRSPVRSVDVCKKLCGVCICAILQGWTFVCGLVNRNA